MTIKEFVKGINEGNSKPINFIMLGAMRINGVYKPYGYYVLSDMYRSIQVSMWENVWNWGFNTDDIPHYDEYSGKMKNNIFLVFCIKKKEKTVTYYYDGTNEFHGVSKADLEVLQSRGILLKLKASDIFLAIPQKYFGKESLVKEIQLEAKRRGESLAVTINKDNLIVLVRARTRNQNLGVSMGIEVIKSGAIEKLENLRYLKLSNTVRKIEDGAIRHCNNLKCVYKFKYGTSKLENFRWEALEMDCSKQMSYEDTVQNHEMIAEENYKGYRIKVFIIDDKEVHTIYPCGCVQFNEYAKVMYDYIRQAVRKDKTKKLILRTEFNGVTFDVTKQMSLEDYEKVYSKCFYAIYSMKP